MSYKEPGYIRGPELVFPGREEQEASEGGVRRVTSYRARVVVPLPMLVEFAVFPSVDNQDDLKHKALLALCRASDRAINRLCRASDRAINCKSKAAAMYLLQQISDSVNSMHSSMAVIEVEPLETWSEPINEEGEEAT